MRPGYPLVTERLLPLRPFHADDFDAVYAIDSRPDVARYLYWGPRSRDEAQEALERRTRLTAIDEEDELVYAMLDAEWDAHR